MPIVGTCSKCFENVKVYKNRKTGHYVCRKCVDFFNYLNKVGWQNCGICGNFKRPALRLLDGRVVCHACYRNHFAPRNPCEGCGRERPTLSRFKGKRLCSSCRSIARNNDPKYFEKCVGCGEKKPVVTRNIEGVAICHNCHFKGVE